MRRYADSEVVRDFTDASRYNLNAVIGAKMGLDTRSHATLWEDTVMHLVTQAVNHSFRAAGFGMVDHHTMLSGFWDWYHKEMATRGYCPGRCPAGRLQKQFVASVAKNCLICLVGDSASASACGRQLARAP